MPNQIQYRDASTTLLTHQSLRRAAALQYQGYSSPFLLFLCSNHVKRQQVFSLRCLFEYLSRTPRFMRQRASLFYALAFQFLILPQLCFSRPLFTYTYKFLALLPLSTYSKRTTPHSIGHLTHSRTQDLFRLFIHHSATFAPPL